METQKVQGSGLRLVKPFTFELPFKVGTDPSPKHELSLFMVQGLGFLVDLRYTP